MMLHGIMAKAKNIAFEDGECASFEMTPVTPFCYGCGESDKGHQWRRQNTAYNDDESNWSCLCPECQDEADSNWQDMWDDYYGSVI